MSVLGVVGGAKARFGEQFLTSVAAALAVRSRGVEDHLVFPLDIEAGPLNHPAPKVLRFGGVATTTMPPAHWPRERARRCGVIPARLAAVYEQSLARRRREALAPWPGTA